MKWASSAIFCVTFLYTYFISKNKSPSHDCWVDYQPRILFSHARPAHHLFLFGKRRIWFSFRELSSREHVEFFSSPSTISEQKFIEKDVQPDEQLTSQRDKWDRRTYEWLDTLWPRTFANFSLREILTSFFLFVLRSAFARLHEAFVKLSHVVISVLGCSQRRVDAEVVRMAQCRCDFASTGTKGSFGPRKERLSCAFLRI